ncbi:MAG: DPP IV N-terminal domain-containing protein [Gemmatimonadales bacterium]|nr:MAG: DPP IV N-terminal domain-containing protein [Gemmatimonadales bacterium]
MPRSPSCDLRTGLYRCAPLLLTLWLPAPGMTQVTSADYTRADRFLSWNAGQLVTGDQVVPNWLDGDRFWYRNRVLEGHEFVLVDPTVPSRRPAFDHHRIAAALSMAADTSYVGTKLPFDDFEFVDGGIRFHTADSVRWSCTTTDYFCTGPDSIPAPPRTEITSPDGRWVAFSRDENLWVRSTETGEEIQLSTDGEEDFGYAVPQEGCCSVVTLARRGDEAPPVLAWSPDSRMIGTHRLDERAVEQLHLLETATGRPVLHSYRVALPGDSVIPTYEVHLFDVEGRSHVRADVDPIDAVNTSCCGLAIDTLWKDARWGEGADELFFTRGVRSYDTLQLHAANTSTGETRMILEETSKTYVEANAGRGGVPNWRVINDNSEVVWWSERDGWGHLYLFDAASGELRNRITEGPWMVADLLVVDEASRWVYFTAVGREEDRNPYYQHLYRARLDGSAVELLSPEEADHQIRMSPSGRYFVDQYGTYESAPVTVLRDRSGRVLATLEEADFSTLLATGWRFPVPFTALARDGVTPVHGLLFFPSDFDEDASYPVVDYIYPGPQVGPIRSRQGSVSQGGNAAALAELGFIVFQIDALGTPLRDKAFHDAYYGNMRDNGIPDHIAALRQLATRYPQMDLDRVGIFGHSGGGFSSTDAILSYPDFFKVAVSTAGNHDNRSYDFTWGEKYHGLLTRNPDGTDSFDSQANQNIAHRLEGKVLFMYGTLDDNVHPNANLLVIDELIRANKDFDLVVLPNRNHGFSNEPYVIRRTWDYFVRHLKGVEPPEGFEIVRPTN